jgi:cytochrome c556
MKGNKMTKKITVVLSVLGFSFYMSAIQAAEPLAFQGVMRDLGKHMQTVAGAIAVEDWELVAKTAHLIGEHPKPSLAERTRIFSFVGTNMGKFKEYDNQTHEAAHEMEHAAHTGNGMQVISQYQKLQTGCLGCHQAFRASFVEHFYGTKK